MTPFQKDEEEKIVFKLSARELAWFAAAVIVIAIIAAVVITVIKLPLLPGFILTLLLAVPVLAGAVFMAFNKVKHCDHDVTRDRHVWQCLKYRFEPKEYYSYRRNIVHVVSGDGDD